MLIVYCNNVICIYNNVKFYVVNSLMNLRIIFFLIKLFIDIPPLHFLKNWEVFQIKNSQ